MSCPCDTIGKPKEILLCPDHHRYWFSDRRFDSVSSVIRTLLPTDFSQIRPNTLECARLRGVFVDAYFSEWLVSPQSMMSLDETEKMLAGQFPEEEDKHILDTVKRIHMLLNWWEQSNQKATGVQKIVCNEALGIAGTYDLSTVEFIYDVKAVSALQPSYRLQLGAFLAMDTQVFPAREAANVHVTKDRVKVVKYEAKRIKQQWNAAANWWQASKELSA